MRTEKTWRQGYQHMLERELAWDAGLEAGVAGPGSTGKMEGKDTGQRAAGRA